MAVDVEVRLRALGGAVAWVDEDVDLVGPVRDRLAAVDPSDRRSWRRRVAVAAAVLVVGAGTAIGPVRTAVADLLGLGIVEVKVVDVLPPSALTAGELGRPVSLEQARDELAFEPQLPEALGLADEVYLDDPPSGVTFVWRSADVFVTQHPGDLVEVSKLVLAGALLEPVTVDGLPALWIEGRHAVTYTGPGGDRPRLADNVLVWSRDGVVTRLETNSGLDEVLALAESMAP